MHDDFRLSQSKWIPLLSIAHRYEFLNVWKRAIREVYDRELVECMPSESDPEPGCAMLISLAEKYDVPLQHVERYIVMLVTQSEPLTEDQVALFSTATMYRLARAREELLRRSLPSRGQLVSANFQGDTAKEIVSNIWRIAKKSDG
jgi:hypothetical protein